ncbi:MAG: insulinase family protein, partial [Rubricoccaceae bacterium]|nr:insulinase family protein [Rubricoccaceae bacterium]
GPGAYPTDDNPAAGDMQALDVLAQYAFSPSSEIYQRLVVEEQKVDQFFSYFPDRQDPYLLTVMARVKDPADLAYVRDAIQETLATMRAVRPDEARINDIKSALKYGFAAGMDNSEALADAIVSYVAATRDVETINEVYANYDSVTPDDIQRVANRYFVDRGMIVTTLSTGELEGEATEVGSVDDKVATAGEDAMPTRSERVQVPRFEGAEPAAEPEFGELITQNSSPIINFRLLFNVGSADDPAGKEGLATLAALMVADAGSEALAYSDIQRALFPLAAGFGASVDKEMTVFTGAIHRDNLARYYDIVASQLFTPAFREEDFTRVKTNLLNEIRVGLRSNNDEELGKEVLYEMIYAGHPYGHLNLGHAEAIEALTIEDVRDFYNNYYTQDMLTVGITGDLPDAFLARFRDDLTGELPHSGMAMDAHVPEADPIEGLQVTLVDKDTRAVAISMGFPIDVRRGDPDFVAMYLLRSYFGEHRSSNSYLYQRIREIRGMNYGDYAYIEYFPNGMFQFYPSPNLGRRRQIFQIWIRPVPPEQAHFAFRIAKFELDRLIQDGISEEDFEATRDFLMKYVNVLTASQGRALGYALDSDYYGIEEFTEYIRSGLEELTLDDVNRALRRHLQSENMAAVVITPNAEEFRDALLADSPSPMEYASEKSDEIYAEDEVIQQYPLNLNESDVRVISVDDVFEQRVFE